VALSFFDDKSRRPSEAELAAALGRSHALWTAIKTKMTAQCGPLAEEWKYSGKPYGWGFRLVYRKRTILHLVPGERHFLAGFCLGAKAVAAARQAGLSPAVLAAIEAAPQYAEGRGFRMEVRTKADAAEVLTLAALKLGS